MCFVDGKKKSRQLMETIFSVPECHDLLDFERYYADCMEDVCSCEDDPVTCTCLSLANFANACARKGKSISWRQAVPACGNDEAHFWLNGYVNKQNCRIWSEANPQVYVETPLHPEKLTVWFALWAGGIIGPYFFKNDEGHNVTVNGDRYRAMITNFFIPELNNHDVQELWFQQDGATCHTTCHTIDLLKDTLGDRLISRF
ncbi:putative DD41D transposase [Trichonephila clavipes]|nr:putative DD41D transposase [Trichonephila clavipes]